MRHLVLTILLGILLLSSSCHRRVMYSSFYDMPTEGWHKDSILTFSYTPTDSVHDYSIRFVVRHTNQYPYQNMWLFVNHYVNDSVCLEADTVECILADDYGRWYGKGISVYELPMVYMESYHYKRSSCNTIFTLTLQQGMRSEMLRGIQNIGVEIVKY